MRVFLTFSSEFPKTQEKTTKTKVVQVVLNLDRANPKLRGPFGLWGAQPLHLRLASKLVLPRAFGVTLGSRWLAEKHRAGGVYLAKHSECSGRFEASFGIFGVVVGCLVFLCVS